MCIDLINNVWWIMGRLLWIFGGKNVLSKELIRYVVKWLWKCR